MPRTPNASRGSQGFEVAKRLECGVFRRFRFPRRRKPPESITETRPVSFKQFNTYSQGIEQLQRSLERGRLAHAYLFAGDQLGALEALARTLAKTLNCEKPVTIAPENPKSKPAAEGKSNAGLPFDCCDHCSSCRKIDNGTHPDVFSIRPESKLRQIRIRQVTRRDDSPPRVLIEFINLKPTESPYKIGIIVAADRMNEEAANALLKTLEEPPRNSVLILLSTEPQRILDTIRSRCRRVNFGGERPPELDTKEFEWLKTFSDSAAAERKSLLGRYTLLDTLLKKLTETRTGIEENLKLSSPLEKYDEVEASLREQWEKELDGAVESEYRRRRSELLLLIQWWLRDIWLQTLASTPDPRSSTLLTFPQLSGTSRVAQRITAKDAMANLQLMEQLQRRLHTNVQEALALEVSLLKLKL
ncbi:MAG: hypothetical protein C5B50_24085 [Verrucomicrobia bacterium]|nr:MAG: hypothetical protein C5B50_24085 [Verrucomicrobiota bacterium]